MSRNPLVTKARIVRNRSFGKAILVTAVNGLLALMFFLYLTVFSGRAEVTEISFYEFAARRYAVICALELGMFSLLAPGLSAGLLSEEREAGSMDLLLTSAFPPGRIVTGKAAAAFSEILLLIVSTAPVFCLAVSAGGIRPLYIAEFFAFLLLTVGYLIGCSLLISSLLRRSTLAVSVTYLVLAVLFIGTLLQAAMTPAGQTPWIMTLNPVVDFMWLMSKETGSGAVLSGFMSRLPLNVSFVPDAGYIFTAQLVRAGITAACLFAARFFLTRRDREG